MRYYYDLHIHSALSPCANDNMTPKNIILESIKKGLDIISVTDHNSCGNVEAILDCKKDMELEGKDTPIVIPGIEVETSEEVHATCLFTEIDSLKALEKAVRGNMLPIKNKPGFFGNQFLMDKDDNILGQEEQLLLTASSLSLMELFEETDRLGGVCIPAHITNSSYSLLSNFGTIPTYMPISFIELPKNFKPTETGSDLSMLKQYPATISSDAHSLDEISVAENFIDLPYDRTEIKLNHIIDFLKLKV